MASTSSECDVKSLRSYLQAQAGHMADTSQGVRWSLVQGCPIRQPEEWSNPTLSRAQIYARCTAPTRGGQRSGIHRSGIHDGICVTGVTSGGLPLYGFSVDQEFAAAGGSSGLQELCSHCPANAAFDGMAGCFGWFGLPLYSSELDNQLRRLAADLDLTTVIQETFPTTALLWFSFWIKSPLSHSAIEALAPLLEAYVERHLLRERGHEYTGTALLSFIRAMQKSRAYGLALRVEMTPPGHTDFGYYTVFAHCPRCKAPAPVERWKKVRHAWLTCSMCSHEFDPALTTSSNPDNWEDTDLCQLLGEERFRSFAINYLVAHHRTEDYATKVVNQHLAPPDAAVMEQQRLRKLLNQQKSRFISTVLFAGCERVQPDAGPVEERISADYRLTFDETKLLLQRARVWGATVHAISHHSQEDDLDELWVSCRDFATPEEALQDLRRQGCSEWFSVMIGVDDAVVERWESQQG